MKVRSLAAVRLTSRAGGSRQTSGSLAGLRLCMVMHARIRWRVSRVTRPAGPPGRLGNRAHPGQRMSAKDPRAATTKPPGFGGVIRVQALTSCRWYTRSCRKQRPSESVANAEPFEHWPGDDHWSRSTLSKLRAIISAAAASSAETTACSCDQYHSASAVGGAAVKVRFGSSPPNPGPSGPLGASLHEPVAFSSDGPSSGQDARSCATLQRH